MLLTAAAAALDDPLAVYVHWPFCVTKCPYCDFNSHVRAKIDEGAAGVTRCCTT